MSSCNDLVSAWEDGREDCHRLSMCMDSELVTGWINGECKVEDAACAVRVGRLQDLLATWQRAGRIAPWTMRAGFCRAIPREQNSESNSLANATSDVGCTGVVWFQCPQSFTDVVSHSDGACRGNPGGESSCAAIVCVRAEGVWRRVVHASRYLGKTTNNLAELGGLELACELLESLLSRVYVVE